MASHLLPATKVFRGTAVRFHGNRKVKGITKGETFKVVRSARSNKSVVLQSKATGRMLSVPNVARLFRI